MNPMTFLRTQWDRVGAWICIIAGALVLFGGWWGISGTTTVGRQMPYIISGGLTGVFLLGIGGMLWVSADLRDEWRALWAIRDALHKVAEGRSADFSSVPALTPQESIQAEAVLAGSGYRASSRRRSAVGDA